MEIEVEQGREAMGEEDERGRGLCDSEISDGEDEQSERVESYRLVTVWRQCEIGDELPVLDYLWACGRVRP